MKPIYTKPTYQAHLNAILTEKSPGVFVLTAVWVSSTDALNTTRRFIKGESYVTLFSSQFHGHPHEALTEVEHYYPNLLPEIAKRFPLGSSGPTR